MSCKNRAKPCKLFVSCKKSCSCHAKKRASCSTCHARCSTCEKNKLFHMQKRPVQHANQGHCLRGRVCSVTDLLADLLALTGSATLDGLTAQGNVGCDQLLCNDVNCTDVFTTAVDASGAVSCAAQPQAPSPGPRCRPQGPCQAAR